MTALTLVLAGLAIPAAVPEDPVAAIEAQQKKLYERLAPSVVFITTKNALGSGFFVSTDGLVLTNAHVVGSATQVDVVLFDGRKLVGTVEERAAGDIDLALVRVLITNAPVPRLAQVDDIEVGSFVASVSHGRGAIWTFNTGMVSNIYPSENERPVFQTQIPLNPGSSGGPVVDRAGNVVGVVTSGMSESNSINFAIKIDVAYRALKGLRGTCPCLVVKAPAGVPIFVNDRMAGVGPELVIVARPGEYKVFAVMNGRKVSRSVRFPEEREVKLVVAPP
jgi:serine protease Do